MALAGQQTKRCGRCGKAKPIGEFYRHRRRRDGRQRECKPCCREMLRDWRRRNPDKRAAQTRREYPAHQLEIRARRAVLRALERGDLTRPDRCEECGSDPGDRVDGRSLLAAHHDDYSRPLDVRWLCPDCHADADRARA